MKKLTLRRERKLEENINVLEIKEEIEENRLVVEALRPRFDAKRDENRRREAFRKESLYALSSPKTKLRRAYKKSARETIKKHYVILVLLCVFAAFIGAETSINSVVKAGRELMGANPMSTEIRGDGGTTVQGVSFEELMFRISRGKTSLKEIKQQAEQEEQKLQQQEISSSVLGRNRGIFANIANSLTAGTFAVKVLTVIANIVNDTTVAAIIAGVLAILAMFAAWLFIVIVVAPLVRRIFLEGRTYDKISFKHFVYFYNVKSWTKVVKTMFLTKIFVFLWDLTIIGGLIKYYSYLMVPFIVAENPNIKPLDAINLSRRMMKGHKFEAFIITLSFLPMTLIGSLFYGIGNLLYVTPYKIATTAEMYAELRAIAKATDIEGAELLSDTYLFEKADIALLSERYSGVLADSKYIASHQIILKPVQEFFCNNLGIWIGTLKNKMKYERLQSMKIRLLREELESEQKMYPDRLDSRFLGKLAEERSYSRTNYLKSYTICSLIVMFAFFSFIGWAWEVSIHIVKDGLFVNRGTMYGPWLPIYGGGAVMILTFLRRFREKPFLEAITAILLCGFVEYMSSYLLEITKGMRWWDYTGYFLNINGRICGEGLMVFAIAGLAAVYVIAPAVDNFIEMIKPRIVTAFCIVFALIFIGDFIYSQINPNAGDGVTNYDAYKEVSLVVDEPSNYLLK